MVTEQDLIDRICLDFPCTWRSAKKLIDERLNAPAEKRDFDLPPKGTPVEPKVKPMKRWRCRGSVCDGYTQRDALRVFRTMWRDVKLDEVVRITRHGHFQ